MFDGLDFLRQVIKLGTLLASNNVRVLTLASSLTIDNYGSLHDT